MAPRTLLGLLLLVCALIAASCTPGGQPKGGGAGGPAAEQMTEPGIEFTRISAGLPSRTLDYIGGSAVALAGAKAGNKVYFAVREEDRATIYCRDLDSGSRTTVISISDLLPGSLTCNDSGDTLIYNRGKRLDAYIDDPLVREPVVIAVPYRLDVASGEDEAMFDFRGEDYLPYRADRTSVFLSPDGRRVVLLSYNRDDLTLATQVRQWLGLYDDLQTGGPALAEWGLDEPEEALRMLLTVPYVRPRLRELGVEPAEEGPVTEEEHAAMQTLRDQLANILPVLLINEDGEARQLDLSFPDEYSTGYVHSILAVSNNHVLLYASPVRDSGIRPHKILSVDLQSGQCSPLSEFLGSASTIEISKDESEVLVVYNPVDLDENVLLNQSNLLRIPLDGGPPVDTELPGDYVAYVDITLDGSALIGQQSGNNDLYLVDTASAERELLCKLLGQVEGLFIADNARSAVYLENGIIYHLDIPPDPDSADGWVSAERFSEYKPAVDEFIAALGFEIPGDLTYEWEEREGLGAHEVSVGIFNPDKPGALALLRYSLTENKVVSLWFPAECPFTFADPHTGADLDYYESRDIAEQLLAEVGWLNPETIEEYHPGPNPLYDSRTNSFIVIFRDGYWYGSGEDERWIYNQDATIRIYADTGMVAEMTLSSQGEVQDQPISLSLERAEYFLRNEGDYPIPEGSPIRFDLDNRRLVIGQKGVEASGPATFTSRMEDRICYEIDAYLQPEDILMMTGLVDTETGEVLGQIDYEQGGVQQYVDMTGAT